MRRHNKGFTLIEILIALFIFTILSMIIVGTLHNVFSTQASTQKNAARLAELQVALTLMSRDFEQVIDRSIVNASGSTEEAFIGSRNSAVFTHAGLANPLGALQRTTLQRTRYLLSGKNLVRETWSHLDQGSNAKSHSRVIIHSLSELRFEYLDKDAHFHNQWPPAEQPSKGDLPRAVKVILTLPDLGKMTQLYIILGQKFGAQSN